MNSRLDIEDGAQHVPLEELLPQSDFVIITCSLTPETRNLFNVKTFRMMKKSAILINTSRGGKLLDKELDEKWIRFFDKVKPVPVSSDFKSVPVFQVWLIKKICLKP